MRAHRRSRMLLAARRVPDPARWRAARWGAGALAEARRSLRSDGIRYRPLPPPPPRAAGRGAVVLVLRLRRATCLERSVVLQAWDAHHGRPREVVIGVARTGSSIGAHAWLAGEDAANRDFREITRIPVPAADGHRQPGLAAR